MVDNIIGLFTGLATAIPLIIALVKYIEKAVKEKNWNQLLSLVINLMETAEAKFETGAERKEWCLMMVKASADTINYPIDINEVSKLIDSLCDMSNIVNAKIGEIE